MKYNQIIPMMMCFSMKLQSNPRPRPRSRPNPSPVPTPPPSMHHVVIKQSQHTLIVTHMAGFFSCCSVKLHAIVEFANSHGSLPENIDGTGLFTLYKMPEQMNQDITHVFFRNPSVIPTPLAKINYRYDHQFIAYSQLDYHSVMPIINNYFEPSTQIISILRQFETKYGIDAANCIAIYYRGTDKTSETKLDSFDRYYEKLTNILNTDNNDNCKILLQSDSTQFFDYMKCKLQGSRHFANLVIIEEIVPTKSTTVGTHLERTGQTNHSEIKHLIAVVMLISKCKHVICSSGNVSMWIMLYRGNSVNVHQNLNLSWMD